MSALAFAAACIVAVIAVGGGHASSSKAALAFGMFKRIDGPIRRWFFLSWLQFAIALTAAGCAGWMLGRGAP